MATTPTPKNTELPTFLWVGTDKRNVKMKGEIAARHSGLVRAQLRQQGIKVITVKHQQKQRFGAIGQSITPRDIATFSRMTATMLKSGVPIVTTMNIISEGQKKVKVRDMVNDIRNNIESGLSLSEALNKHPAQFDALYRNLVKAGESAGMLETLLHTIANYKEKIESLKGKIKKAMFYPIAVCAVATLVTGALLIFVVPQFEAVFSGFGADLPALTQLIVNLSRLISSWWWIILFAIGGAIFSFITLKKRSVKFVHFLDRTVLKLPVIGKVINLAILARFSRTLAITFAAGVPLVEALETVAGATGNIIYEEAVLRIRDDVAQGHSVNLAMRQTSLFPSMLIQMTAIGEESGSLDSMLLKVTEVYEEEVDNAVDSLTSLLEPLIIVLLGGIVCVIVVAMYLPIFKLASVI